MENNKINTGIDNIDNFGIIPFVSGKSRSFNTLDLIKKAKEKGFSVFYFDLEQDMFEYSIENLRKMMDEIKLTEDTKKTITKHELIGGTVFPVNYHPNGMITMDYPDNLFCSIIKNKPYVQDNTNPIVQDNQNPIVQNNQNNITQDNS